MARAGEPHVHRSRAREKDRGCPVIATKNSTTEVTKFARALRVASVSSVVVLVCASAARAQTERPKVGPERPFQLAPRVERTLPNGLRVIVTRQTVVPKVSVTLTLLSGLASDPPALAGLATITGEAIQEGTKLRTSQDIRR